MKRYSIFIVLGLLVLASCNKKPTVTPGRPDMLRTGSWVIESGTVKMKLGDGHDTTLNYLTFLPQCHKDDYIRFHAGTDAAIFSGSNKCNPGEPDSSSFSWTLGNNNNSISFYNGWDFIYSLTDSILPFHFDTLSINPYLVLDTIHGVNDTTFGYTRAVVVLDTIWDMKFDSAFLPALKYNQISNATITNFSQSSFTISFWIYAMYADTTGHHTNQLVYIDPTSGGNDTLDYNPIYRNDTFFYQLTYKNQ